jgi:hypothetical protein
LEPRLSLGLDGEDGVGMIQKHIAIENLPEGMFVLEFSTPEMSYCHCVPVQ